MSTWSDRIAQHPVWGSLEAMGSALDKATSLEGTDAATLADLARLKTVLAYVGKRLDAADPALLYPALLDGISGRFQTATVEVANFSSNGNTSHVGNATTAIDAVIPEVGRILVPTSKELAALRETAGSYRSAVQESLHGVQVAAGQSLTEVETLRAKISELSAIIDAEKSRMTSTVTDFQSQFSTAQETRSSTFTEREKDREDKFGAALTENAAQLKEALNAASQELEQAREQRKKHLSDLAQGYEVDAKISIDQIDAYKDQVEKLVGVIGNLGVTSGYQKTADDARKRINSWQRVTVAALLGVIIFAFLAFLPSLQKQTHFEWSNFAGRIVLTLAVGVLAGYAAKEAVRDQDVERRNRRRALELEAIGPYLALLPVSEQVAVRVAIAQRYFGVEDEAITPPGDASPTNVGSLIASKETAKIVEALIDALVKIAKR